MNKQLVLAEVEGALRNPARLGFLATILLVEGWQLLTEQRHLYSYTSSSRKTADSLCLVMQWLQHAQRPDGGISAYYSLLSGYVPSYPETTGYLIPTFYNYANLTSSETLRRAARAMTRYLLPLQLPNGAFPGGIAEQTPEPSVFNTGQILMGLVRSYQETGEEEVLETAIRAADWLVRVQHSDGRWEGPTYQGRSHTYYTMVAWALALLNKVVKDERYAEAARANIEWALQRQQESGWFDGINLKGHPDYLHFIAYVVQGLLETSILLEGQLIPEAVARSAWRLLRIFEIRKHLPGAFGPDWKETRRFTCITGNAQMSCIWSRLYRHTGDLRYLNAALKVNEYLKERLIRQGPRGVCGGVAGSHPVWGRYHPLHYVNWGAKFMADALMEELLIMNKEFGE